MIPTGRHNEPFTVVSPTGNNGDPGADPNELVEINAALGDIRAAQVASETFSTLSGPKFGVATCATASSRI